MTTDRRTKKTRGVGVRRGTRGRTARGVLAALATMLVVASLPASALGTITVTENPDEMVTMNESVTVSWAEPLNCNLSYGRVPGTYTDETTAQGWGSLVFTPASEGMSHGVYYCVVSEVGGEETSDEFLLVVDSQVFPTPTLPVNGSTIYETTTSLAWDPVDGVPYYHVVVSDHEMTVEQGEEGILVTGASIIWQAITGGTSIQYGSLDPSGFFDDSNGTSPPLMSDFDYEWLVFSNFGNNPLLTSRSGAGLAGFDVDVPVSMDPPVLVSPPDSVLVTEEYLDFEWDPVADASSYHVYLYEMREWNQSDASFPVWDGASATTTAHVHVGGFLISGDYRWRVVALDSSGRGIASETRHFEYSTETGTAGIRTKKEDGQPLASVLIEIELEAGGVNALPGITDGSGAYDKRLIPGDYLFYASKPDYVDTVAAATVVADGFVTVPIELRKAPARIRGVVEDEQGEPVFDALIEATATGEETVQANSDASGNFLLQATANSWTLVAEKDGYAPSEPVVIELHADDYVVLASPLTLSGTPGTVSGNVTNGEAGAIVGATVHAESSFGSQSTTTDFSGHYSLELAPGEWSVWADKSGFVASDERNVAVSPGGNHAVEPPLVLEPAGSTVMGWVTDGEEDFADAWVVAVPPSGDAVETVTNGFGEFLLTLPSGTFSLVAERDGCAPSAPHQVNVESGESYTGIELLIAQTDCLLEGTVTDGTGPVEGALVTNGDNETHTSQNGAFSLPVRHGLHELSAEKSGYLSGEPLVLAVSPDQTLSGLELEVNGGAATIAGRAISDGLGVAGAVVTAASGRDESSCLADENGDYALNVEAGEWAVTATGAGFVSASYEEVVVAAGQTAAGVDPELSDEGATIRGSVTHSRYLMGRAVVSVYRDGETEPQYGTSSNYDGWYTLRVDPGVAYTLIVTADRHGTQTVAVPPLTPHEVRLVNLNPPDRGARVTGVVTGVGDVDVDGALVETPSGGGESTNSGASGRYELWLSGGTHEITISRAGYEPAYYPSVSATVGEDTELDCELSGVFATVEGHVTDALTRGPLEGVLVTALTEGGASDVTGPDGSYRVEGVVPGDAEVYFIKNGYIGGQSSRTLAEHETHTLDVELTRLTGSIAGTVRDGDTGLPLPGVSVRAKIGETVVSTDVTAADGRYTLEGLSTSQAYGVYAAATGYSAYSENPVTGVVPTAAGIDFDLIECNGQITGFVLDGGSGDPLAGASVSADDGQGHFGSAMTAMDGSFTIDGLAQTGLYDIVGSLYGFHDAEELDVAPGAPNVVLELPRNFATISGNLVAQGSGVTLSETEIVATNIALAHHSRTAEPDELGAYEVLELRPGSYVLSVTGGMHLGTPAQMSLEVGEGETIGDLDFVVERADVQRVDVVGPDEIETGETVVFSGSVFAQGERLVDVELEWWYSPLCAGSIERAAGTLTITEGYVGELTVSAREPESGTVGRASSEAYVTVTPATAATLTDSLGMTLEIEPGSVAETKDVHLTHETLPDVKRYDEGYVVQEQSYSLKPNGVEFVPGHLPLLTLPGTADGMVRWSKELLTWETMNAARTAGGLEAEISDLGEYATKSRSGPLGVSDLTFEPNPFSPEGGPVTISYDLTSNDARMPFVTVRVFNMAAQLVREIVSNEPQGKGRAEVQWDGLTDSMEKARNGRYVVEVKAEDPTGTETTLGTVVLVK